MSDDSSSVLKRIALAIGKILAYGVAWFLLTGISGAIFDIGFGMGEDPSQGFGLLTSTLVVGAVWMWRMGWLKWNREDSEAEIASSSNLDESDQAENMRKWHQKKRFIFPMALSYFFSPIGIWKIYKIFDYSEGIWYDNSIVTLTQTFVFPPVGIYGIYKSNILRRNKSEEVSTEVVTRDRKSDSHLEESSDWYWAKKGSDERNGPVSRGRLEELAEEGELESDDLVWKKEMDDWKEAGSVEGLEGLFESPPPLPDDAHKKEGFRDEKPPSLPKSFSSTNVERASEEEALKCVHDYDENNVCNKCGWSKQDLKNIEKDISTFKGKATTNDGDEDPFWKRHPIWTGTISIIVYIFLGMISIVASPSREEMASGEEPVPKELAREGVMNVFYESGGAFASKVEITNIDRVDNNSFEIYSQIGDKPGSYLNADNCDVYTYTGGDPKKADAWQKTGDVCE